MVIFSITFLLFRTFGTSLGEKLPNIIFVVADDLGWNDVSWNNPNIYTPNLEALALSGVILNQSYVQPTCTPSRTAFLTGYYPYRLGRQNRVLYPLVPTGVSLKFSFLPEKLQKVGYSTHMIGKWHLGFCNISYTPTYRGFDSFFGFYNGALDHFNHTTNAKQKGPNMKWSEVDGDIGYDLRNNTEIALKYKGIYSTELLANVAKNLIRTYNSESPLYLYLSFQSVHSPLQVPKAYEDLYSDIRDEKRRKYCGMVTAMDDAVGVVVDALREKDLFKDSIFIFTSDNGGQTTGGGNNWPLRGNKGTLWEGGTRAVTFVHGSRLKKTGYVNNKLFHAVDWYSTILHLAGVEAVPDVDGIDQSAVIVEDADAVRNEIVYNIYDLDEPKEAIRVNNFKLIQGFPGKPFDWISPAEDLYSKSAFCNWSNKTQGKALRLYDLQADPLERHNLAQKLPDVVELLKSRLAQLRLFMVPADDPRQDERGEPRFWGNTFSPGWCVAK